MSSHDSSKQPGVKIGQIFLERANFSHRGDYLAPSAPPTPDTVVGTINVEAQGGVSTDGKNGLVRLHVSTIPENRPFYEFDISMVALVTVDGDAPNMPLEQYVATLGSALLYPFMRQLVADLTGRGRFGPVWLNPINLTAAPPGELVKSLPKLREHSRSTKKARAKARS